LVKQINQLLVTKNPNKRRKTTTTHNKITSEKNSKIYSMVKIPPEFTKEKKLYLRVKASKGKIGEKMLIYVFLRKKIDNKTKKL